MAVIVNKPAKAVKDAFGTVQGIGDQFGGVVIERRATHKKDNFRIRRPNVLDNMDACVSGVTGGTFSPQHGWVSTHNPAALAIDFADPRPNAPCFCSLSIAPAAGSSFVGVKRDLGGQDGLGGIRPADGTLLVPFKIETMPLATAYANGVAPTEVQVDIKIMLSTTDNFNTATAPATATSFSINTSLMLRQGWNDVMVSAADDGTLNNIIDANAAQPGWKYEGTAPGNANTLYRYMRIVINAGQPTAVTPKTVYKVGGVFQGGMARPNIILHCDDGHKDTIDLLRIYNARKIPVTIGVISENSETGKGQAMSKSLLRRLYNEGNDLVSHTASHPASGGLANLTPEQLKYELEAPRDWLRNNQFPRTSDMIVYPENNYRDRDLAAVKAAGYSLGRGRRGCWVSTIFGIDNPLALGSRDIGGQPLARVKKMVDSAVVYGCTQILYMHQIASVEVASITFNNGIGTVVFKNAGSPVPANTLVYLRGADTSACNIAALVDAGATAAGFTFKYDANAGIPNGTITRTPNVGNVELRFYSPTWPAAGGTPPSSLYWHMSDHIALANYIADEWAADRITPICMAELAERCMLG